MIYVQCQISYIYLQKYLYTTLRLSREHRTSVNSSTHENVRTANEKGIFWQPWKMRVIHFTATDNVSVENASTLRKRLVTQRLTDYV